MAIIPPVFKNHPVEASPAVFRYVSHNGPLGILAHTRWSPSSFVSQVGLEQGSLGLTVETSMVGQASKQTKIAGWQQLVAIHPCNCIISDIL